MPGVDEKNKPIVLIALGGNALIRKGQEGAIDEQFENLRAPMRQIAELSREYRIIITHGNGPQVGGLLLQQECCDAGPKLPLEILVAQTQGQIGYMIESTLDEELMRAGVENQPLVSVLSYVVVDKNDPAMLNPTKPVGPVLSEGDAALAPYAVRKTAKGLRRVVGSPEPVTIVEKREIARLMEMGFIVICCGGGGIPVTREGRGFQGVDAVIDKDLASSLLAREIGVDLFVVVSDIAGAFLDYGAPGQRLLEHLTIGEADEYIRQGHFPPGSMLPKVTACRRFTAATGRRAAIGAIERVEDTVRGIAGTRFVDEK